MRELRDVKLDRINPNPFRDGSGGNPAATWETVEEAYGFDKGKLDELASSIQKNGVWPGTVVRQRKDGEYELAFGHHRVQAAKMLGLKVFPVVVEHLSDDQMLNYMASENSEEYGHDFLLGVMNAVEATVRAFGAGKVELEKAKADVKDAPSFLTSRGECKRPYNAVTVSKYLGWVANSERQGEQASKKVKLALAALELIERGVLKRAQLKGLGSSQAMELVTLTSRKIKAEEDKAEAHRDFLEKEATRAAREGDRNKLAKVEKALEKWDETVPKMVENAGKSAAATVAEYFKESKSMASAVERAAEELGVKKPEKKPPAKPNIGHLTSWIERLDSLLPEDDHNFLTALKLAPEFKGRRVLEDLDKALNNVSKRALTRAAALRKVVK